MGLGFDKDLEVQGCVTMTYQTFITNWRTAVST